MTGLKRIGGLTGVSGKSWLAVAGILFAVSPSLPALDHVVLQLKWRHQFQFAGYYAAIEKGYYREAGLEVELREATPGHDPLEEVLMGHAQFGVGTSNLILARGRGDPVVVLAVIYQHSPFALLAPRSNEVRDIHDLANKPIMMEPDAAELLAYFQSEGMDPGKLKMVPHTFGIEDVVNGKVAALSAYSTDEPFLFRKANVDYLLFTPRSGGIDFYGDNLFTTEQQIQAHPERVRAFLDASLRGWDYAMKHPQEIIELIQKKYNRGKSDDQLGFEAVETARLVHPELIELGYVNPGRWRDIAQTYEKLDMLPKDFSLDGFLYERNPKLDLRWLYWGGGVILAIAIGFAIWSLLMWVINRRLRGEVRAREAAEAALRAESAAKTQFCAILAHEVRTPLATIHSALWLHEQSVEPEEKREMLQTAGESVNHLLETVDHILNYSQIEAGRLETEFVRVNVAEFFSEIARAYEAFAIVKGLQLVRDFSADLPEFFVTDPVRLRQIVSNLLSNAIKFTQSGSVRLGVDSTETPEGRTLRIRVQDTGAGIPPEKRQQIFEPYSQANIRTDRGRGTGLGLTISAQLAALLGGEISVDSQLGEGSTFTLVIVDKRIELE